LAKYPVPCTGIVERLLGGTRMEPDVILDADLVDQVQLRLDEFHVIFPSIG
jgi:hypothetical protein